jgi:hypothetical protein
MTDSRIGGALSTEALQCISLGLPTIGKTSAPTH